MATNVVNFPLRPLSRSSVVAHAQPLPVPVGVGRVGINYGDTIFVAPALMSAFTTMLVKIFGPFTAACLDPIRDLAPRIVAAFIGGKNGWTVFTLSKESSYRWWPWGPFGSRHLWDTGWCWVS